VGKSISVAMEERPTICTHHWKLDSPSGPWSLGICDKCGEYDAFKNFIDETTWSGPAKNEKSKKATNSHIISKTEFLESCIPFRQSHNGAYTEDFKIKMASLAISGTRSFIRKKFNIPETTLRGWIKTYKRRNRHETRRIST